MKKNQQKRTNIKTETKKKNGVKLKLTRAEMVRTGVDEVHKAGAAVELGEKNGGVGLRFRALNPVQTGANTAIFAATFAKYSATITTHPHFEQQQWQN